jgi:hypothetical protein
MQTNWKYISLHFSIDALNIDGAGPLRPFGSDRPWIYDNKFSANRVAKLEMGRDIVVGRIWPCT